MRLCILFRQLFVISSSLISLSLQVDVGILFAEHARRPYQIWSNVPPGRCCTPTPSWFGHGGVPSAQDGHALSATIAGLVQGDIGFVWADIRTVLWQGVAHPGCSRAPWQSRVGPGSFIIKDDPALLENPNTYGQYKWVTGISYISLPKALPNTNGESLWISAQGISTLILGGGKWLPDGVTIPIWKINKRETSKYKNKYKGYVEWRSPHFFKYPDIIEVEGVNYTDAYRGDLMYKDSGGKALNLTTFEPI
ncbi:MAG: hypothetical protein Q9220_005633 [cf. Caloplaca sp. 1 TL-2023]